MSNIIDQLISRARANKQRIVLPESLEERTLTAADKALADAKAEAKAALEAGDRYTWHTETNKQLINNIMRIIVFFINPILITAWNWIFNG
mgnify:CR=1 FL=1